MDNIVAFVLPFEPIGERLLYVEAEYVAESLADHFRQWVAANPDTMPTTYRGESVIVGRFTGKRTAGRGFAGTFTSADGNFPVHDGIISY